MSAAQKINFEKQKFAQDGIRIFLRSASDRQNIIDMAQRILDTPKEKIEVRRSFDDSPIHAEIRLNSIALQVLNEGPNLHKNLVSFAKIILNKNNVFDLINNLDSEEMPFNLAFKQLMECSREFGFQYNDLSYDYSQLRIIPSVAATIFDNPEVINRFEECKHSLFAIADILSQELNPYIWINETNGNRKYNWTVGGFSFDTFENKDPLSPFEVLKIFSKVRHLLPA